MAGGDVQKLKLFYLYDILKERTDEEHAIGMGEIIKALDAYGVHAERKAIYNDIQTLKLYGADIQADTIPDHVTVDRIAPTIAKSIRIRAPNACAVEPLF